MVAAPRVLVAGLSGGGGKTLVAVGVTAAWRRAGHAVAPVKKGPDYIDAAWLSRAAGTPCRNVDLFLMAPDAVLGAAARAAARADLIVIEGNRGLFDGADARGTVSTAALATLLAAPVVLVVDCTKVTRTVAALVLGCQHMDPQVGLAGVILNRVAGRRHEAVLRDSIAEVCGLPVLGALPRLTASPFGERHLGLVPPEEHGGVDAAIARAAALVTDHVDLAALEEIARRAVPLSPPDAPVPAPAREAAVRIGVFRDAAFQFYYPDNLEALTHAGAQLIEVSPLADRDLPAVDALYLGGGFPETLAAPLADNRAFRAAVRRAVEDGLPTYAECGGAVYLGTELVVGERRYPMAGALPVAFGFGERPQGHGYAEVEAVAPNPFYAPGETVRGHEFHYTRVLAPPPAPLRFGFRVRRGFGFDGRHDGLCHHQLLATYTHVHALGTPTWARALVTAAARRRAPTAVPA
jgi:cobyrinic acid a,c-diamide synthase